MSSRRLEARIKELCVQALRAESEIEAVLQELQEALHEFLATSPDYNELIKKVTADELSQKRLSPISGHSHRKRTVH